MTLQDMVTKQNKQALLHLLAQYHRYGCSWSELQIDINDYIAEGLWTEEEAPDPGLIEDTDPYQLTGQLQDDWDAYETWLDEMDKEDA